MSQETETELRITPLHASRGFADESRNVVIARSGSTLSASEHGRLLSPDFFLSDADADVPYVEIIVSSCINDEIRRAHMLTPQSAIALGERLAELGRALVDQDPGRI